jgi:DNA-binding LytR/AlgR family response regulator
MQIRTICVSDDTTHDQLLMLVEQLPQCDVMAWLRPNDLPRAVADMRPDLVLVAPGLDLTLRDPGMPYVTTAAPDPDLGIVALPVMDGIELCPSDDIIRVQGEGNYVRIVFRTGPDLILAKSISECEMVFRMNTFMRVHRSNVVNLRHVRRLLRGKTMRVQMINGDEVDVSATYREALLARFAMPRRKR